MNNEINFFKYKVAVGISLKKLREGIFVDGKKMSQQLLNNEISINYSKSWNAGREESLPNLTIENLLMICDYFKVNISDFFKLVESVTDQEVLVAIEQKTRLKRLFILINHE